MFILKIVYIDRTCIGKIVNKLTNKIVYTVGKLIKLNQAIKLISFIYKK